MKNNYNEINEAIQKFIEYTIFIMCNFLCQKTGLSSFASTCLPIF